MKANSIKNTKRDYGAVAGIAIAAAAVAGGFIFERGRFSDLGSAGAGLLVFGGTIGAVIIGTPSAILRSSLRRCRSLFARESKAGREAAHHIMRCAVLARRLGLASIEQEAEGVDNGLLRRALLLVVDGVSTQEVRRQLQIEIVAEEDRAEADARVFEQAGGYAPTIGIIGAVIGLIQVMRQLGNVDEVGRGIAAAFTATLYGVALANLLLLPIAARIRSKARSEIEVKELILEGVTALGEGLSLRLIRARLETLLNPADAAHVNKAVTEVPEQKAARKTA
jgi:chemotaxis protein MotA